MTFAREVIADAIRDAIQLAQGGYEGQHPADAALEALEAAGFTVARLERVGWDTLERDGALTVWDSTGKPVDPIPDLFRILPEKGTP